MKTLSATFTLLAAALFGMALPAFAQTTATDPAGVTGTLGPNATDNRTGFAVQDGVVYFIRNGRASLVDEEILPKNQMMIATGRMAEANRGMDGFIMDHGVVSYVRGGRARRVDDGFIPAGQIMTVRGTLVPMPLGVVGLPGTRVITVPGPGPAPATSTEEFPRRIR